MKKILIFLFVTVSFKIASSQSFNEDKTSFVNFLKRMHASAPFEGVKIVSDYNQNYLISVLSLDKAKYSSEAVMFRVAQVKAQSGANTFLNGATISAETIIKTTETTDTADRKTQITETIEQIKQNAAGFSQGLELMTNFLNADNTRMVFIYGRELKKN